MGSPLLNTNAHHIPMPANIEIDLSINTTAIDECDVMLGIAYSPFLLLPHSSSWLAS